MKRFTDIKEIHQRLFEMLDSFASFCDEHNITYFLAYGTLLGAVRHKDFIPWDDDVDVLVPRPDYEKLLSFARQNIMLGNFRLEIYDSQPQYLYPFCKLVDTNTTMKERIANPWPMGLFLDIFPLDGVPQKDLTGNKTIRKLNIYYTLLNCTIWKSTGKENAAIKILFAIGSAIPKLFNKAIRSKYPKKIDSLAQTWDFQSMEYVSNLVWDTGLKKIVYDKKDFFPAKELPLNNRLFKVPNNYEYLLSYWYGNYMQLPPEKERIPHIAEAYDITE